MRSGPLRPVSLRLEPGPFSLAPRTPGADSGSRGRRASRWRRDPLGRASRGSRARAAIAPGCGTGVFGPGGNGQIRLVHHARVPPHLLRQLLLIRDLLHPLRVIVKGLHPLVHRVHAALHRRTAHLSPRPGDRSRDPSLGTILPRPAAHQAAAGGLRGSPPRQREPTAPSAGRKPRAIAPIIRIARPPSVPGSASLPSRQRRKGRAAASATMSVGSSRGRHSRVRSSSFL